MPCRWRGSVRRICPLTGPASGGDIPRSGATYFARGGKVGKTPPKPHRFRTSRLHGGSWIASAWSPSPRSLNFAVRSCAIHFACRPADHRSPNLSVVAADRARSKHRCGAKRCSRTRHSKTKAQILFCVAGAGERGKRRMYLGGCAGHRLQDFIPTTGEFLRGNALRELWLLSFFGK